METNLLLLILGILRNKQRKTLRNTPLAEEAFEFFLNASIEVVELPTIIGKSRKAVVKCEKVNAPEDPYKDPYASNPPRQTAQYLASHQGRTQYSRL